MLIKVILHKSFDELHIIWFANNVLVSGESNFFDIFRWRNYWKLSKFYVLILTIFWKKMGKLFKGGYFSREVNNQENTVQCSSALQCRNQKTKKDQISGISSRKLTFNRSGDTTNLFVFCQKSIVSCSRRASGCQTIDSPHGSSNCMAQFAHQGKQKFRSFLHLIFLILNLKLLRKAILSTRKLIIKSKQPNWTKPSQISNYVS